MKKAITLIAILAMLLGALVGCGSDDKAEEADSEVPTADTASGEAAEGTEEVDLGPTLASFTTTDIDGNEVTQDVFADYDLTMVNIWATWCGYCITEMPELSELYGRLPANTNLITICNDASSEMDLAKEILADCNAEFLTLQGSDDITEGIVKYVPGFPSTIFVDSEGNLVGNYQGGLPATDGQIADAYLAMINDNLKLVS